jgi:hypothetical protein
MLVFVQWICSKQGCGGNGIMTARRFPPPWSVLAMRENTVVTKNRGHLSKPSTFLTASMRLVSRCASQYELTCSSCTAIVHPLMHYGSSGGFWPRIRSQLTLAHDAALVRLIDALYLIFKLAIARRQSLDHDIRSVRDVQANRVRGKQPLAELESVLRHNADTLNWVNARDANRLALSF